MLSLELTVKASWPHANVEYKEAAAMYQRQPGKTDLTITILPLIPFYDKHFYRNVGCKYLL